MVDAEQIGKGFQQQQPLTWAAGGISGAVGVRVPQRWREGNGIVRLAPERVVASAYTTAVGVAPLGVKPFSLLCLLLAARFGDADVWRVTSGTKAAPQERRPLGPLLVLKTVYGEVVRRLAWKFHHEGKKVAKSFR